jgi:DNA-binding CsgD family transcriptional regulator
MADDAGEQKRPGKLRAIPLGERFVLLSIDDYEDSAAGAFDDGAFRNDASLSAAERDVAELAARGLSNTEIARARRVATRTIANQLAGVYRKLGVSGRRELRAWFRGRRSGSIEKSP